MEPHARGLLDTPPSPGMTAAAVVIASSTCDEAINSIQSHLIKPYTDNALRYSAP